MKTIKKLKRRQAIFAFFHNYPKIVIASNGRSGSSLLFQAIVESMIKHRFRRNPNGRLANMARRWCGSFVKEIGSIPKVPGHIYKTHSVFQPHLNAKIKYIFIYADPLESAKSVAKIAKEKGTDWFKLHQSHLGGHGDLREIFNEDVLNYQRQMESWLSQSRSDVICVDYDDLWDEQERLSQFLGYDLELPQRLPRTPKPETNNINQELFERLRDLKRQMKTRYLASSSALE